VDSKLGAEGREPVQRVRRANSHGDAVADDYEEEEESYGEDSDEDEDGSATEEETEVEAKVETTESDNGTVVAAAATTIIGAPPAAPSLVAAVAPVATSAAAAAATTAPRANGRPQSPTKTPFQIPVENESNTAWFNEPQSRFHAALQFSQQIMDDTHPSVKCTNGQKLQFYGFFKQAAMGDCKAPEPGTGEVNHAKWSAWSRNSSMGKFNAMRCFVALLDEVVPGWGAQ
jgi:diazepam-binding inhibitor (GABA receptor modulating acyl-CoA-binding protein)